jgi:hypothetical protein
MQDVSSTNRSQLRPLEMVSLHASSLWRTCVVARRCLSPISDSVPRRWTAADAADGYPSVTCTVPPVLQT